MQNVDKLFIKTKATVFLAGFHTKIRNIRQIPIYLKKKQGTSILTVYTYEP